MANRKQFEKELDEIVTAIKNHIRNSEACAVMVSKTIDRDDPIIDGALMDIEVMISRYKTLRRCADISIKELEKAKNNLAAWEYGEQ